MAKQQSSHRFVGFILDTFVGPLLWGLIATFAFYFAVRQGLIQHELIVRYTAGHPVEYVEVGLFFVGLMAIIRRGRQALIQLLQTRGIELQAVAQSTLHDQVCGLTEQLEALPRRWQHTLYGRRLSAAIDSMRRHHSTAQLDDELKYLSDLDAEQSHEGYALVRIIIWATPMLGFLGTVIGITLALGDLSPEALVNSPKEAMEGLLSGLSVAFDTTALALTLSIVLMFSQFVSQQIETQLVSLVDRKITDDLSPYFRRTHSAKDPQTATLQQLADTMAAAFDRATQQQIHVWQQALKSSHEQWVAVADSAGRSLQDRVAGALSESLERHTQNLLRLEEAAGETARSNWQQFHTASTEILQDLREQKSELNRHSGILSQALQATGEVVNLEKALNQNLRALAGAKNFEDTVMSLSAAIHLLSSRLSKPLPRDAKVRLETSGEERAA